MALLDQLKKTIQENAILGAALRDGSIRIIYKHPPEIDAERLFRTWTIEVLIVDDSTYNGLINKTLERLGWTTRRKGDKITATKDEAITPAEREEMKAEDQVEEKQQQAAATERRDDLLIKTLEAMQQRIDDLEERLEFMSLVKSKGTPGPAGAPGIAGPPGRDGQDIAATETKLQELVDVSGEVPRQGQILMWIESAQGWELRFPPQSASSEGGGGGGGGGLKHWTETEEGHLLPNENDQNIGSEVQPIGSLYAKGNTVYLDNKPLNINENQRIAFDGNQLGYGDGDVLEAPENSVAYVRKDASWVPLDTVASDIEIPTSISSYPTKYANIVVDMDTGLLVAVEPLDVIAPE